MKETGCFSLLLLLLLSCSKPGTSDQQRLLPAVIPELPVSNGFIKYTIAKNQQYCDLNIFLPVSYTELKFIAKFDSSAIYSTVNQDNQYDINKLYGFADNNSTHQQFSARFGWRWSDNALRLFGYVYNNGVRDCKELGTVSIGQENNCSIKIAPAHYIFSLNGIKDSLPRTSTTPKGAGYKLYPYFGGDEFAPHNIYIWIKEL